MSPTAARKLTATIRFTPGTVISRRASGQFTASCAITRSNQGDLAVEEIDLPQTAVQRLAFRDRQLEPGQPRPARLAEQITGLGAALEPPDQDRVDLVLSARARRHQLRATRQPTAHHPGALVGHPHTVQDPAANKRASVRASRRSVFARA